MVGGDLIRLDRCTEPLHDFEREILRDFEERVRQSEAKRLAARVDRSETPEDAS